MTDLTRILKLDADQIHELLMNHELFPAEMVKLAARRKVILNKEEPVSIEEQFNRRLAQKITYWGSQHPTIPIESRFLDRLIGTGLW